MISDTEGGQLVRIAREAVEAYLGEAIVLSTDDRIASSDKMGVFVTLNYLTAWERKSCEVVSESLFPRNNYFNQ